MLLHFWCNVAAIALRGPPPSLLIRSSAPPGREGGRRKAGGWLLPNRPHLHPLLLPHSNSTRHPPPSTTMLSSCALGGRTQAPAPNSSSSASATSSLHHPAIMPRQPTVRASPPRLCLRAQPAHQQRQRPRPARTGARHVGPLRLLAANLRSRTYPTLVGPPQCRGSPPFPPPQVCARRAWMCKRPPFASRPSRTALREGRG